MDKILEIKNFCKEQMKKIHSMDVSSSYFQAKEKAYEEVLDFIDELMSKNKKDVPGEKG